MKGASTGMSEKHKSHIRRKKDNLKQLFMSNLKQLFMSNLKQLFLGNLNQLFMSNLK
jgi:hypothetical protein